MATVFMIKTRFLGKPFLCLFKMSATLFIGLANLQFVVVVLTLAWVGPREMATKLSSCIKRFCAEGAFEFFGLFRSDFDCFAFNDTFLDTLLCNYFRLEKLRFLRLFLHFDNAVGSLIDLGNLPYFRRSTCEVRIDVNCCRNHAIIRGCEHQNFCRF